MRRLFYDYKNYLTWLQVRCAAEVITNLFLEGVEGGGSVWGGSDILDLAINHTLLVFSGIWLKWVQSTMNQILHKTSTTKQPMMCTYACMNDFLGGGGCLCRTDDISKSVGSPGSLSAIIATSWKYAAISTSCHVFVCMKVVSHNRQSEESVLCHLFKMKHPVIVKIINYKIKSKL